MSIRRTDETLISTPTTTHHHTDDADHDHDDDPPHRWVGQHAPGPGLSYSIITTLRDNTALTVLRQTRDERGVIWINVKTGGPDRLGRQVADPLIAAPR